VIEDDVKRLSSSIRLGIRQSASDLTIDARASAREMGWQRSTAGQIKVTAEGDRLSLQVGEQAQEAEYGGPDSPPSPAVRRWTNDNRKIDGRIVSRIGANLRGVL